MKNLCWFLTVTIKWRTFWKWRLQIWLILQNAKIKTTSHPTGEDFCVFSINKIRFRSRITDNEIITPDTIYCLSLFIRFSQGFSTKNNYSSFTCRWKWRHGLCQKLVIHRYECLQLFEIGDLLLALRQVISIVKPK